MRAVAHGVIAGLRLVILRIRDDAVIEFEITIPGRGLEQSRVQKEVAGRPRGPACAPALRIAAERTVVQGVELFHNGGELFSVHGEFRHALVVDGEQRIVKGVLIRDDGAVRVSGQTQTVVLVLGAVAVQIDIDHVRVFVHLVIRPPAAVHDVIDVLEIVFVGDVLIVIHTVREAQHVEVVFPDHGVGVPLDGQCLRRVADIPRLVEMDVRQILVPVAEVARRRVFRDLHDLPEHDVIRVVPGGDGIDACGVEIVRERRVHFAVEPLGHGQVPAVDRVVDDVAVLLQVQSDVIDKVVALS